MAYGAWLTMRRNKGKAGQPDQVMGGIKQGWGQLWGQLEATAVLFHG